MRKFAGPLLFVLSLMLLAPAVSIVKAQYTVNPFLVPTGSQLLLPDGNVAAPSLVFASSPTAGFYTVNSSLTFIYAISGTARVKIDSNLTVGSAGAFRFTSGDANATSDLLLTRGAAATLQQGAADAAAPVNQTLQAQGVAAGTNDISGANYTITSGNGRGNAAGSQLVFRTPTAVGSGNGAQTMGTRLTLDANSGSFTGPVYSLGSGNAFWTNVTSTAGTMTNEYGIGYAAAKTLTSSYAWTNAMLTAGAAATTWDVTVATLPAKTQVLDALVVILTAQGSAGTLAVACGDSGVFNQFVISGNAKSAANTVYGDAGAERGAALWTSTEGNIGPYLPSYTATTTITCRFISDSAMSTMTTSTGRVILTTRLLP